MYARRHGSAGRPALVTACVLAVASRQRPSGERARLAAFVASSAPVSACVHAPRNRLSRQFDSAHATVTPSPSVIAPGALVAGCFGVGALIGASRRRRGGAAVSLAATEQPACEVPGQITGPTMRVAVFGATGYIGKAVVQELASRGHSVVAATRASSGIGGKQTPADVEAMFGDSGKVSTGVTDVADQAALAKFFAEHPVDAVMCCLASRSGGRQDSFDIDYQATVNCADAARTSGAKHFVLLSAVCVQRPLLAFQEAKLKAEAAIAEAGGDMSYSFVRPTAYFKSLLGQVKGVKGGAPFVMFGDGTSVRCKPISEQDTAAFMADCLWDPRKQNAILPVGGPGNAMSFKEQGELIYKLVGREPSFICVPYVLFDIIQAGLDFVSSLFPNLADIAEYGRIGRYYAEQSMLVLDPVTGQYSGELTPSYGKTSLRDFLVEALGEGSTKMEDQQLGEQGLGSRVGLGE